MATLFTSSEIQPQARQNHDLTEIRAEYNALIRIREILLTFMLNPMKKLYRAHKNSFLKTHLGYIVHEEYIS